MHNSPQPYTYMPHKKVLAKIIAWGAFIISTMAFICVVIHIATLTQAFEIGLTAIAVLISIATLRQIYQEHEACFQEEQKLKQALIIKICHDYPDLPQKNIVSEYIEQTLEGRSSPYIRLEILAHYRQDSQALNVLIEELRHRQSDIAVLEDLGLRWENPSSNHSDYENEHDIAFHRQV